MSFDNYSTDGAICPYCQHLNEADGDSYGLFSEATDTWFCEECSEEFLVSVSIRHSWKTEALKGQQHDK